MIWLLGGVASAATVLLLYGSRPTPTVDVVSTDRFFAESRRTTSLSRFSLPTHHWLSLLFVLLLCLGFTALAILQSKGEAKNEAVVVDLSSSMGVGGRLEEAAAVLAARWGNGPLLGAGDGVFLLHGETVNPQGPLDALENSVPMGEGLPTSELIQQALSMVPGKSIVVISDQPSPQMLPNEVTWSQVGKPGQNTGIVRATASRIDTLGSVQSTAVLVASTSDSIDITLQWREGAQIYASQTGRLSPNEPTAFTTDFVMPQSGTLTVSVVQEVGDAWIEDDAADISVADIEPIIVSGTTVSPFWIAAFQAHPHVTWVPKHPKPDLWVTGHATEEVPVAGRYLFVGEAVRRLGNAVWNPRPQWSWAASNELLTEFADVRSLNVHGVWEAEWPLSRPLVRTNSGTVVAQGTWNGQPAIAWGIDLAATDAALRTQFVNWVANVVRWSQQDAEPLQIKQMNPMSARETLQVSMGVDHRSLPVSWANIWRGLVFGLMLLWGADILVWRQRWHRMTSLAWMFRLGVFAVLLLLALMPWSYLYSPDSRSIHLVDRSISMGLIDSTEAPGTVRFPEEQLGETGTPLGPALRRVLAQIPAGITGEIAIHTDGRWTDYFWTLDDIQQLMSPHDVRLVQRTGASTVSSCTLQEPWVRIGEVFSVSMVTSATQEVVAWRINGREIKPHRQNTRVLEPSFNETTWVFSVSSDATEGPFTLTAEVQGEHRCSLGGVIRPAQRIWMVSDTPNALNPIRDALQESGFEIQMGTPEKMLEIDLAEVDLVVLGGARYEAGNALDAWIPKVHEAVEHGMGLVMVGGESSYDSGRWGLTPLRHLSPLALETEEDALDGAVSFLAVLDKSGSMAFDAGDRPRMSWANAATLSAIRQLRSTDRAAVLAVDDTLHWTQGMRGVGDGRAFQGVRGIRGGKGGMLVYSALVAAQDVMAKERSPVRHLVLFADAQDAEEKVKGQLFGWGPGPSALDVAKEMAADGITMSVVAIGDPRDQDVAFLELLASVGNGRFHITRDAQDLVGLFTQETQRLIKERTIEGQLSVVSLQETPFLDGISLQTIPPLKIVNDVQTRTTVRPFLETASGAPVLSSWRVGLGRVTAFTGFLDGGEEWAMWSDHGAFWRQSLRWAAQPEVDLRDEISLRRTTVGDIVVTRPIGKKIDRVPHVWGDSWGARLMWPDASTRWQLDLPHKRYGTSPPQRVTVQYGESSGAARWIPAVYVQEYGDTTRLPRPPKPDPRTYKNPRYATAVWPLWIGLLWILVPLTVWSQRGMRG